MIICLDGRELICEMNKSGSTHPQVEKYIMGIDKGGNSNEVLQN